VTTRALSVRGLAKGRCVDLRSALLHNAPMRNPFEFGRELTAAELVDREDELAAVLQTMRGGGRLFLIGPRRYGKTSLLRAAAERAEAAGVVVLRHDAEAYPTLARLAEAVVAEAARRLTGPVEKAGQKVRAFFGALRPEVSYDPLTNGWSVSLAAAAAEQSAPTLLVDVLGGLDRLAADAERPVAVVLDEFQHVIENRDGLAAERQLRAAVQTHAHVAYVFAGSKTTLLSEMTSDPSRPFYRLGERLFLGAVPREDFRPFIRGGFEQADLAITEEAVETILDLSEDVPYNVQRLAYACWNEAQSQQQGPGGDGEPLDAEGVRAALDRLVRRDDPFYTQAWNRLSATQRSALLALVEHEGSGLYSREVLRRTGLPLSTMRTALDALVKTGIAREDEARGGVRLRLEDPFFTAWLRMFVGAA
jgi:hypothetical protein